ncbi:MAG TPA: ABC transporter substrate-binding protein [Burkholderiaceae bacterium]|nr:ABC transporter substrate-binding protein [Burkholderiaceae bacterium]
MVTRRDVLAAAGTAIAANACGLRSGVETTGTESQPRTTRVLRYAFPAAESFFDPAQTQDLYSRTVCAHIFDALYEYEPYVRPFKLRLNTAAAFPEVADSHRTFTFRVRPGIYFADDPAFKGKRRELVAADYVYTIKRFYDPQTKSPMLFNFENAPVLGLSEVRQQALRQKRPFDYAIAVEGVRTLDRYTLQVRLGRPNPRFAYLFANSGLTGAVAREVAEAYGEAIAEHPVGTGPFRLAEWRRASRIVLERSPTFRDEVFDYEPPADDPELAREIEPLRGRRTPLVERVEISIIEEPQPRWLSFLAGESDLLYPLPDAFANVAVPNGRIAPHLVRDGVRAPRTLDNSVTVTYFNFDHAIVGGYTPQRVALRRAINLGVDIDSEIRLARRGLAIPAQSPISPHTDAYDPALRTEMSTFDRARARTLLDMYGYVDRDGDGWREQPDGAPLVLEMASLPDSRYRELNEQWKRDMDALALRIRFNYAPWPELLKQSNASKLMMWGFTWQDGPDCDTFLGLAYGPNRGQLNDSRFDLPAYNNLYERQRALPDGDERLAAVRGACALLVAYAPYKFHVHRVLHDLVQPWLKGFRRPPFTTRFWNYLDVDPAAQAAARRA